MYSSEPASSAYTEDQFTTLSLLYKGSLHHIQDGPWHLFARSLPVLYIELHIYTHPCVAAHDNPLLDVGPRKDRVWWCVHTELNITFYCSEHFSN
ncbi:hypothetical protein FKM82_004134 [Ascaphus truei]